MDEQKVKESMNCIENQKAVEGLTDARGKKEQKILRQEYIDAFKTQFGEVSSIILMWKKDGTIVNLGEKFGNKRTLENSDVMRQTFWLTDREWEHTVTDHRAISSHPLFLCRRKKSGVMYLWEKKVCTETNLVSA